MRKTLLIALLALAALIAACSSAPTPPPALPDTRAADVQAVKDVEAAWLKDAQAKNADKWASYFADHGSALYPGGPTLEGKAAIQAAMVAMAEPVTTHFLWRPQLHDPGDEMVLEAAVNGRADALVTFNVRDYGSVPAQFGVRALLPRETIGRIMQ